MLATGKGCNPSRYLKECTCKRILTDDLRATCDENMDMAGTIFISSNQKKLFAFLCCFISNSVCTIVSSHCC